MGLLSVKLTFLQMMSTWAEQLNPLLANPLNNASVLENVNLVIGTNVINHKLGRVQQGWGIVDQQAVASIYRSEPFNATTLTLVSDAIVTVNLEVF